MDRFRRKETHNKTRLSSRETFYDLLETSLGWIGVRGSVNGLLQVTLPKTTSAEALNDLMQKEKRQPEHNIGYFENLHQRLEHFFKGGNPSFDDHLDLEQAPPFFQAAWMAARKIPRGQVRSYAWLATMSGRPAAVRAAGQAMARNPIAILIPCHRVISSSGGLHGYGGGLDMKAFFLALEGWSPRDS